MFKAIVDVKERLVNILNAVEVLNQDLSILHLNTAQKLAISSHIWNTVCIQLKVKLTAHESFLHLRIESLLGFHSKF